jgi:hypothetical protein
MSIEVDNILSKICLGVTTMRRENKWWGRNLISLDKHCSKLDHYSTKDLTVIIPKLPFAIKKMHFLTESLLRVFVLYDYRENEQRKDYFYRLQRHVDLLWNIYLRTTSRFDQTHYIYMYAASELFLFQLKWKKMGMDVNYLVIYLKPILEMLQETFSSDTNIFLPHAYAKDLIFHETFQFFN